MDRWLWNFWSRRGSCAAPRGEDEGCFGLTLSLKRMDFDHGLWASPSPNHRAKRISRVHHVGVGLEWVSLIEGRGGGCEALPYLGDRWSGGATFISQHMVGFEISFSSGTLVQYFVCFPQHHHPGTSSLGCLIWPLNLNIDIQQHGIILHWAVHSASASHWCHA